MLAPSPYTRPPARWTVSHSSWMLVLNRPRVLGWVIIRPASRESATAASASRSMLPLESEGMVTTWNPAMAADAGLVPWALSGMATVVRWVSPRSSSAARIISMPQNSPWAPARGDRPTALVPVISARYPCRVWSSFRAPCTVSGGWRGCRPANPGRNAISSFTLGLYFIVQLPRG